MYNSQKNIEEVKKYCKKLIYIITNDAILTLFGRKIVDRAKIDDILCCIEACLPEEYKQSVKKSGKRNMPGYTIYMDIINKIRNKSILGSDKYSFRYNEVIKMIDTLPKIFATDFEQLLND